MSWTPVPEKDTVAGELLASLLTTALPVSDPVTAGANVTLRTAVWPGARIWPVEMPFTVKPAPETVTPEMVTLELPALVNVELRSLVALTPTLPKFRLLIGA
jgi:hypothetical protein